MKGLSKLIRRGYVEFFKELSEEEEPYSYDFHSSCPHCHEHIGSMSRPEGDKPPEQGDFLFCGNCASLLILDAGLIPRLMEHEELVAWGDEHMQELLILTEIQEQLLLKIIEERRGRN